MARFKRQTEADAVENWLANAQSEVENLAMEMQEWADNMEMGGLDMTPKYEEVTEAAEALEGHTVEVQTQIDDLEAHAKECPGLDFTEIVEVTYYVPYGKRSAPRHLRRDQACAWITAAHDALEEQIADAEADENGPDHSDAQTTLDELQGIVDELECVDFPGMFG